mmetsp:Transcript_4126/g.6785  ORF Transcript_4126/g.6785 Transcript_4126/m.6785 type:complete len:122 (+) Transcript_4126:76-441(+)
MLMNRPDPNCQPFNLAPATSKASDELPPGVDVESQQDRLGTKLEQRIEHMDANLTPKPDRLCQPADVPPATFKTSDQRPPGTMTLFVREALQWLVHYGLYPASPGDTTRSDEQHLLLRKTT